MDRQILNLPFQADFIPASHLVQMQRLLDRKFPLQTRNRPSRTVCHIQKPKDQLPLDHCFSFAHLYLVDLHLAFLLDHLPDIRFVIRHIKILIKGDLILSLAFLSQHMQFFF